MKKVLQQGAEAIIYLDKDKVIKDRIKKSYRISELDDKIRKQRTKSETKLLEKASNIINSVTPLKTNEKFSIEMPFIEGKEKDDRIAFSETGGLYGPWPSHHEHNVFCVRLKKWK